MGYEFDETLDTIMDELGISDKYQGNGNDIMMIVNEIERLKSIERSFHELSISTKRRGKELQ